MKFLNCLALLIIISCGSGDLKQNTDDMAYQTSGVEQYFLTELPHWANGSLEGQCMKASSFTYLDFPKLAKSYELSYVQMTELQAQYNHRLESYFRSTSVRFLKPVEQASFFSNSLEQVRSGTRQLKLPQVKDIDVIWLEGFIQAGKQDEIKKMADAGRFDERLPIIYSSCLSHQGLNQWLSEHNLEQVGFYLLSAEWLNPYGSDLGLKPGLSLELKKIISPDIKVNFVTPDAKYQTNELVLK